MLIEISKTHSFFMPSIILLKTGLNINRGQSMISLKAPWKDIVFCVVFGLIIKQGKVVRQKWWWDLFKQNMMPIL